jgi:hypothetical protein
MNTSYAELLEEEILRLSQTAQVLVHGRQEIARRLPAVRDRGGCFTVAPGPGGHAIRAATDAWLEWEFGTGHMTFRARLLDVSPGGAGALLALP